MEREMMERKSSGMACGVMSFFIGGAVGAGVALLLAPKTGSEMREQIKDVAGNVKGKADDYYGQLQDLVTSAMEQGSGIIDDKKKLITAAVQAAMEAYDKVRQDKGRPGSGESYQPAHST